MIEIEYPKGKFEGFTPYTVRYAGGFAAGTHIHEDDKLCISHIVSRKKGTMKAIMNFLVKEFDTNKVWFYGLLNNNLENKLKGFVKKQMFDDRFEETVDYLEGEWLIK